MLLNSHQKKRNPKYEKFYSELISSLEQNDFSIPDSIAQNKDGELFNCSIGGKHDYNSYAMTSDGEHIIRGCKNRIIKLIKLATEEVSSTIQGLSDSVVSVVVSKDDSVMVSASFDNEIAVWVWFIGGYSKKGSIKDFRGNIKQVLITPDSRYIIGNCDDSTINVWDFQTFAYEAKLEFTPCQINRMCVSPNSKYLVCGADDETIKIWELDRFKLVAEKEEHFSNVTACAFCPTGRYLYTGSENKSIKMWILPTFDRHQLKFKAYGAVENLTVSEDGKYLAASSHSLLILFLIDEEETELRGREIFVEERICSIFIKKRSLICGCTNDRVISYDLEDLQIKVDIKGESHTKPIVQVVTAANSKFAVTGTVYGDLKVWNLESYQFISNLHDEDCYINDVSTLCISGDSKYIACAPFKEQYFIKLWSSKTQKIVKRIEISKEIDDIIFSFDSKYLIGSCSDEHWFFWDLKTLEEHKRTKGDPSKIMSIAVDERGKFLIASSFDRRLIVWDYESLRIIHEFTEEEEPSLYHLVIVSYNARYIATASDTKEIDLWSMETMKHCKAFKGHTDKILDIAFSPDANYIISCSRNDRVLIWSCFHSDTKLFVLEGETKTINSLCITNNSKYILGGSDDSSINVWTLDSNLPLSYLENVQKVPFYTICPDSSKLAIPQGRSIQIWSLKNSRLIDVIETKHLADLSNIVFTSNSKYILTSSIGDSSIWMIPLATSDEENSMIEIKVSTQDIYSICVGKDSASIVIGDPFQNLSKWSLITKEIQGFHKLKNEKPRKTFRNTMKITPNLKYVLAGYGTGILRKLDYDKLTEIGLLKVSITGVLEVHITNNSLYAITISDNDKVIKITNIDKMEPFDTIENTHPIRCLSLDKESHYMVGSSQDSTFRIYSIESFQEIDNKINSEFRVEYGPQCALTHNGKLLVCQSEDQKTTMIYPFISDDFQTYPFILNLIKSYFASNSQEERDYFLSSLIIIIARHRQYYQVVLNPIFSIITLLLNEEQTTASILSMYLKPYKLFADYDPLKVVTTNNRIESAKTYISLLERYKNKNGFYPYYDCEFLGEMLTKNPEMINFPEMKSFIVDNLFYFVQKKKGELIDHGIDTVDLQMDNFGSKELTKSLHLIESSSDKLLKSNPVDVENFDCFISLVKLDFSAGSEFSLNFFSNLSIFPRKDIEEKLNKLIVLKWQMCFPFLLLKAIFIWILNLLLYLFVGFKTQPVLGYIIILLNLLFICTGLKILVTSPKLFLRSFRLLYEMTMNVVCCVTVIRFLYEPEETSAIDLQILRLITTILVSLKGIYVTRVFNGMRMLLTMIEEVIISIRTFFVLLIYLILIFEVTWRMLPSLISGSSFDDFLFVESLTTSIKLSFNNFDTTDYDLGQWITFLIGNITLNILLLNYLVSIICIAYEKIGKDWFILDLKKVMIMVQEVDIIFTKTRGCAKKKDPVPFKGLNYITLIASPESDDDAVKIVNYFKIRGGIWATTSKV